MHIGSRTCTRCRLPLTDAASMEAGIGPICRKMDNHVLATQIPANITAAREALFAVGTQDAVLTATFAKVEMDLYADTADYRATVKRIEWILSHPIPSNDRKAFEAVVTALGYVALVAMWNGEVAKGKATVRFEAGRLYLKGPNNKAGRSALKAIPGRQFHGETTEWSVPAKQLGDFAKVVAKHWPNHDATALGEALTAAGAHVSGPVVPWTLTLKGDVLTVKTPYHAGFVEALKGAVHYKDRRWNGFDKVWEVNPACEAQVKTALAACF